MQYKVLVLQSAGCTKALEPKENAHGQQEEQFRVQL